MSNKGRSLHPQLKDVERHLELYKELCSKLDCDLAGLALKFALSFEQVSSVLVGIDRIEYLDNSIDVADGNYFDEEILKRARELEYPDIDFLDLVKWERMEWLT